MNHNEIRNILAQACQSAGSQAAWAKRHKVSTAYVNDILMGRREMGDKVLKALGLKREVSYAHK